ncbi:unnamed protein product, partial [Heterosigma akashiwo]
RAAQDREAQLDRQVQQLAQKLGDYERQIHRLRAEMEDLDKKTQHTAEGPDLDEAPSASLKRSPGEMPDNILCPITLQVFLDPVVAADGQTYERFAIEAWLSRSARSPLHGVPLPTNLVYPNRNLKVPAPPPARRPALIDALLERGAVPRGAQFRETPQALREVALSVAQSSSSQGGSVAGGQQAGDRSFSAASAASFGTAATGFLFPDGRQRSGALLHHQQAAAAAAFGAFS